MGKFISDQEMEQAQTSKPAKKFISDEEMAAADKRPDLVAPQVKPQYNALEGAAVGLYNGLTGRWGDEGIGAVTAVKNRLTGQTDDLVGDYRKQRDTARQAMQEASSQNPIASTVGEVGGAIASPLNKLGVTGQLAVAGLGGSNADLTKGEFKDAALDTGTTVLAGKAIGGIANKGLQATKALATKVAPAIGDKLQTIADKTPFVPSGDKASPYTPSLFGGKALTPKVTAQPSANGPGYGDYLKDYLMGNMVGKSVAVAKAGTKFVKENTNVVPNVMRKISDTLKATPQVYGRFAPVLEQAEKRGAAALASAHFLLSQQEPEYRKMQGGDDEQ